jgi:hypothetical protein
MAIQHFLKGACASCGGHLEFPADGAGQTIACPHCGQSTQLLPLQPTSAQAGKRRIVLILLVIGVVMLVALAAFQFLNQEKVPAMVVSVTNHVVTPLVLPPSPPVTPAVAALKPPASQLQPGEILTNEFIITAGRLEPTPGSSLVYVTGKVRNPTDRQRFGVKVRFTLFDASGTIIGQATDYQSEIDPQGEWSFKAMVMESKTVKARLSGISEDK